MYRIICRYLDGPWGSPSHQLKSLLEDADCPPRESKRMTAVTQWWCENFGKEQVWLFWLGAAWVKSRAERPSVSEVN